MSSLPIRQPPVCSNNTTLHIYIRVIHYTHLKDSAVNDQANMCHTEQFRGPQYTHGSAHTGWQWPK